MPTSATPIAPYPLLVAKQLTRHYQVSRGWLRGNATIKALNGVSFALFAGQTLAVVGESGCGKSTLARQLTMIETPTAGELVIDGMVIGNDAAHIRACRSKVQMVFQNPYTSLNPRKTLQATLDEPLAINTNLHPAERLAKIDAMLTQVGLRHEHLSRYPHMFSGGQRQRIAIARAMMLQPKIIVADEPTSALDVSIQAQILNLFVDLQAALATSYVFISHNLAVVEHIADQVLVMYLGSAVEQGDKHRIFARPLHPYTRVLMSATPALRAEDRRLRIKVSGELASPLHPPTGCAFHQRCPYAVAHCAAVTPQLRELDGRQVACHRAEDIDA